MKTITPSIANSRGAELQKAGIAAATIAELLCKNATEKAFARDGDDGHPFLSENAEEALMMALEIIGNVVSRIGDHFAEVGKEVQP